MAKYLSWDMLFKKSYYATARDELEKNKDSMNELEGSEKIYKARSKSSLTNCKIGIYEEKRYEYYCTAGSS